LEAEFVSLKAISSVSNYDDGLAILFDRSNYGLGVFSLSQKVFANETKLRVDGDKVYEVKRCLKISKNIHFLGLRLVVGTTP